MRVPGSSAAYTCTELRNLFIASDLHPGDYPPMPGIVQRGRAPEIDACGHCRRARGQGARPPTWYMTLGQMIDASAYLASLVP